MQQAVIASASLQHQQMGSKGRQAASRKRLQVPPHQMQQQQQNAASASSANASTTHRYKKAFSKDQLASAIMKFFFPKDITFDMIRNEFYKPMKEAATVLEVSVTKLKR